MRWWSLLGFIIAIITQQLLNQEYDPNEKVPSTNAEVGRWFEELYKSNVHHEVREAWQYNVYLKLLNLPENGSERTFLDLGAGSGSLLKAATEKFGTENVKGLEISETAARQASEESAAEVLVGDTENIPWPDNSFDYITMIALLERVSNKTQALSELKRVLKPGGKAIVMGRNSKSLTWLWRLRRDNINYDGHETAYELNDYLDLFDAQKLRVDHTFGDQYIIQILHRWIGGNAKRFIPMKWPPWTSFFMPSFIFILSDEHGEPTPSPVISPWFPVREMLFTFHHTLLDLPSFFFTPNPPNLQCQRKTSCADLDNVFPIFAPSSLNVSIDWADYFTHSRTSQGRVFLMKQAEALSIQNPSVISLYKSPQFRASLSETIGKPLYTLNADLFPNACCALGYDYGGFNAPHTDSERTNGEHWTALLLLNACQGAELVMENQCCDLKPGEGVIFRSDLVSHFVTPNEEPNCIREVVSMDFSNLPKKQQRWTWKWISFFQHFERIWFH